MSRENQLQWWQRPDLGYQNGRLVFSNQDVSRLASRYGTPSFVYSATRIQDNLGRIHDALNNTGFAKHSIYYAMKANRFAPLLTMLKQSELCGIDACSPNEVIHAVSCGFTPEDISFTAGSLSEKDFSILAPYDGVCLNCDSLHVIKRWGQLKPGSTIGIRINPAVGIGRGGNEKLHYAGEKTSKFGIYREQFSEALALAEQYRLRVNKIHFHTGCGYLTEQLPLLEKVLEASQWFIETAGTIERVNIGGGLGVPHVESDHSLDLQAWANLLAKHYLNSGLHLEIEPGDYLVKDAGLLLLGKTYLETKCKTLFLGTDAGFNISPEPAYYQLPFQPVPLNWQGEALQPHHVTGHINEALDIWAEDALLPDMSHQDFLALINAGAYAASMASNHCMRGEFNEFILL
jgi:diaminopimelate decarboxylase